MVEEKVTTLEERVEALRGIVEDYAFRDGVKALFGEVVSELGKVRDAGSEGQAKLAKYIDSKIEGLIERVEEVKGLLRPEREISPEQAKTVGKGFADVVKAISEASGILARDGFSLSYGFDPRRGHLLVKVSPVN